MSIFSIFRRKKKDKTVLKEKSLVENENSNLKEELKLNIKEINDKDIEIDYAVKLNNKDVIARIVNMLPEVGNLLTNNKDKSYVVSLPKVSGKLDNAKKNVNTNDVNLNDVEVNNDVPLAKQIAKYLDENYKNNKRSSNAEAIVASANIASSYIVNEVKNDLDKINSEVLSINSFLSNEYKSKIDEISLFIDKTTKFSDEIISDDNRRRERISQIENHISVGIQLLKQAILSISEDIKDIKDNYSKYEKQVYAINNWVLNLKALYGLLAELCKLDYLYYQGSASLESCEYDLKQVMPEIKELLLGLANWHQIEHMKLDVNMETGEHRNTGLKTMFKKLLTRAENHRDIEYSRIPEVVLGMISNQMNMNISQYEIKLSEVFNKEINLAIIQGEIYYYQNMVC